MNLTPSQLSRVRPGTQLLVTGKGWLIVERITKKFYRLKGKGAKGVMYLDYSPARFKDSVLAVVEGTLKLEE